MTGLTKALMLATLIVASLIFLEFTVHFIASTFEIKEYILQIFLAVIGVLTMAYGLS
jgi:hypothetical protein